MVNAILLAISSIAYVLQRLEPLLKKMADESQTQARDIARLRTSYSTRFAGSNLAFRHLEMPKAKPSALMAHNVSEAGSGTEGVIIAIPVGELPSPTNEERRVPCRLQCS